VNSDIEGTTQTMKILLIKKFFSRSIVRFVEPGNQVSEFDKICEVQSDKASVEITSRYTGTVKKLHYKVGDMARVGLPIADIELEGEEGVGLTEVEEADPEIGRDASPIDPLPASLDQDKVVEDVLTVKKLTEVVTVKKANVLTLATPAVRRLAREHQVDLQLIKGSGKAGRVLKEDVTTFVRMGSDKGIAERESTLQYYGAVVIKWPFFLSYFHFFFL